MFDHEKRIRSLEDQTRLLCNENTHLRNLLREKLDEMIYTPWFYGPIPVKDILLRLARKTGLHKDLGVDVD